MVRIVGRHEPDAKILDDQALFLSFSRSCLKSLFWRSVRPANRTKGSFLFFFFFFKLFIYLAALGLSCGVSDPIP